MGKVIVTVLWIGLAHNCRDSTSAMAYWTSFLVSAGTQMFLWMLQCSGPVAMIWFVQSIGCCCSFRERGVSGGGGGGGLKQAFCFGWTAVFEELLPFVQNHPTHCSPRQYYNLPNKRVNIETGAAEEFFVCSTRHHGTWKGPYALLPVFFLSFANDHTSRLLIKMTWAIFWSSCWQSCSFCVQQGVCQPYSHSLVLKYVAPLEDMLHCLLTSSQGCRFSIIFHYFWPDLFSYFIFLFLNFLSLFVFIFCEMARTHRFSVIFAKVQWHPWVLQLQFVDGASLSFQHMWKLRWLWPVQSRKRTTCFRLLRRWWSSLSVAGLQADLMMVHFPR